MFEKGGYVYLLTNRGGTAFYVGVTSDLKKRSYEHKQKLVKGFTQRYNLNKLVYYESFASVEEAIVREKQIKGGSRKKKLELVMKVNPDFRDLYDSI